MPLPLLLTVAIAAGSLSAWAGQAELAISPRRAFLTQTFGAFMIFQGLIILPIATYFFVFHGDWFILYVFDVRRIPSALALVGLLAVAGIGGLGFALGSFCVRSQKASWAGVIGVIVLLVGAGIVSAFRDRLAVVGTYAQYVGAFGLVPFARGALFQGAVVMGVLLVAATSMLCVRIHVGNRR